MAVARLEAIEQALAVRQKEPVTPKKAKEQIRTSIKNNFELLKRFGKILGNEPFNGRLELPTNPEEINWQHMGEALTACFKPEFEFQPEDITGFRLKYIDEPHISEKALEIALDRNGMWWSTVKIGMIVRKDWISPTIYAGCIAGPGQVKAAREGLERIKPDYTKRDWQRDLHTLEIFDQLFDFATRELQSQIHLEGLLPQ